MRIRWRMFVSTLLVLAASAGWGPAAFALSAAPVAANPFELGAAPSVQPLSDYAFYLPGSVSATQPIQLLVALHGMGGNGADFGRMLHPMADRLGFAVLAPTMPYRDYRDPELVRRDGELHPRLKALIDSLPTTTGLTFKPRLLLFGFSRGSQEATRFSLLYPELTRGVAGLSAGSYTLPAKTFQLQSQPQTLAYPFGMADVEQICGRAFNADAARQVSYWIGVGGRDTRVEDVPRQWDPYVGTTRVERAQRFVAALQQFGAPARLVVYPNAGHEVTDQMREEAVRFLVSLDA